MANLAMAKTRAAKVKEFAKFERDEQITVAEVIKSMDQASRRRRLPAEVAQFSSKQNWRAFGTSRTSDVALCGSMRRLGRTATLIKKVQFPYQSRSS